MINLSVSPNPPINGKQCTITYNCTTSAAEYVRIFVDGSMQKGSNYSPKDSSRFPPNGVFHLTKSVYGGNIVEVRAHNSAGTRIGSDSITLKANSKPINPTYLRISQSGDLTAGQNVTLTWDRGSDPHGSALTYRLFAKYVTIGGTDSEEQLYIGQSLSHSYTIPRDSYKSVRYKIDCKNASSELSPDWRYSDTRNIINNRAPTDPGSVSVTMNHDFREYTR